MVVSIRLPVVLLVSAIGLYLLSVANGATGDLGRDAFPVFLIGASFMISLVTLALVSMSPRPRLGIQLLCIYYTVFFTLPGYHHISANVFPFYGMHYTYAIRKEAAWAVIIFICSVLSSYYIQSLFIKRPLNINFNIIRIKPNFILAVSLIILSVVSLAALILILGPTGLLSTRGSGSVSQGGGLATGILVSFPRAFTFVSLVYLLVIFKFSNSKLTSLIMIAVDFPIFFLSNWPLSLSRFALFGYIICSLVILRDMYRAKSRVLLSLAFVVGALFILPIANALTRGGESIGNLNYSHDIGQYFDTADYDGLQSVHNAVVSGDRDGLKDGRQILSAALFFVPRAIWPGKSEHSGAVAAAAAGYKYLNVSQPLPGEFYLDFGLIGDCIGGILIGVALARLDAWAAKAWYRTPKARLVMGITVGYSIIVYRGALLSIVSVVALLSVLLYIIAKLGLNDRSANPRGKSY